MKELGALLSRDRTWAEVWQMERTEAGREQGEQQMQRSGGGNKLHCSVSAK